MRQRRGELVMAVWLAVCSAGCGEEKERAPMLVPTGGVSNAVSCDGLRLSGAEPNEGGKFWVSGGVAQCAPELLWCPVSWVDGYCEAGLPYARCISGEWVVSCEQVGGGGEGS
jgi:hypothetical protein